MKPSTWIAGVVAAFLLWTPLCAAQGQDDRYESRYYDLDTLSKDQLKHLRSLAPGDVVVVHATGEVVTGPRAENLVKTNQVHIVAMAGVGSSAVGTAALAREIAIGAGRPVAGIVTGRGQSTLDARTTHSFWIAGPTNWWGGFYPEPASDKLHELYRGGARPQMLVGYSRGGLDVANTLFRLAWEGRRSYFEGARFLTFGLGVRVPSGLGMFKQYMGTQDDVARRYSLSFENVEWIQGSKHHVTEKIAQNIPLKQCVNACFGCRQPNRGPAVIDPKAELAGAAKFGAAYLIKEGFNAVETLDPTRMEHAVREMGTVPFWTSFAAFAGAARVTERVITSGPVRARLQPRLGNGLLRAGPLAAGMLAAQAAGGKVDPQRLAVGTASYLAVGTILERVARPALRLAGPRGRVAEILVFAGTLWGGEKIERAVDEFSRNSQFSPAK